jgi:DNA-directed RNA polymerase specialized sigma24 family protein
MEAVFARTEHGGHRVLPQNNGFRVEWPHGAVSYPSARQTIIALVNRNPTPPPNAYDPHLTFDRYFRQGRFQVPSPSVDVFSLFQPAPIAVAAKPPKVRPSPALVVYTPTSAPRGVDLVNRAHEVRKLFYAGFARRVLRYGYDPEDVLQEVYKGILVRNEGKCPFDPEKSSFGHYVHMVCGCIVSNYHRRYSRLSRNEVFGVTTAEGEVVDVAEADLVIHDADQEEGSSLLSSVNDLTEYIAVAAEEAGYDPALATSFVDFLYEGRRNKEIVEVTGTSPSMVSKVLRLVRDAAREWQVQNDLVFA